MYGTQIDAPGPQLRHRAERAVVGRRVGEFTIFGQHGGLGPFELGLKSIDLFALDIQLSLEVANGLGLVVELPFVVLFRPS